MPNTLWVYGPATEDRDGLFHALWEPNIKSATLFRSTRLSDLARSVKKRLKGEKEMVFVIYSPSHDATIESGGKLSSLTGRALLKKEIREFSVAFAEK
jgi:hypothetical protein